MCITLEFPCAAGFFWPTAKNWVTTSWSQFLAWSQRPIRLNSTRLVVEFLNMFRTRRLAKNWDFFVDFSRVELSRVVRVITAPDALWSLLRSDSTQLNSTGRLSWVELSRIERWDHTLRPFVTRLDFVGRISREAAGTVAHRCQRFRSPTPLYLIFSHTTPTPFPHHPDTVCTPLYFKIHRIVIKS